MHIVSAASPKKTVTIGKLHHYRQGLVHAPTPAEAQFCRRLTGGRIKFLFQHVIPPYIVDFFIPKRMLIIELDGAHHYQPEQKAYDERRTKYLESHGFKVVRIPNAEARTWPLKNLRKYPKCRGAGRASVNAVYKQFNKGMQNGKSYGVATQSPAPKPKPKPKKKPQKVLNREAWLNDPKLLRQRPRKHLPPLI